MSQQNQLQQQQQLPQLQQQTFIEAYFNRRID